MTTTADIHNGMVIEHKGRRMKIMWFLHVKPGKGGAFVRTKLKDIVTGRVIEDTFRAGEKINPVRLESREMQYLYSDNGSFVFMDMETYEQIKVSKELVGEVRAFLKEGMMVGVNSIEDEVIGVEPPVFVELQVTETEPGVRGDTSAGGSKPALLETGHKVAVPLFVDIGDVLRIDTRSGEYVERVR